MNWLKLKVKQYFWSTVAAALLLVAVAYYMYRLVKPAEKNETVVDDVLTQVKIHAKESKLRADLEKDKIGAVKKVFESRLDDTKKIDNREDRLNALVRLHEELDI